MNHVIDKLALVHLNAKKILMTLGKGRDRWYLPGGKREKGETDIQALIREIKEELNLTLVPESIHYYGTFEAQAHDKSEGARVRLTCYTAEFTGALTPQNEVAKYEYLDYAQKQKVSCAGRLLFDDLKQKGLLA